MQFRFYITDTIEGTVVGTNDEAAARSLSECEDYFVVDSQTGKWLIDGRENEVNEVPHHEQE